MAFRSAVPPSNAEPNRTSLAELAALFAKLGTIAFGGPAAHIAMLEDEVVVRRRWLTREAFTDYLGATNLIPGPNSTELAIHIGHARAGWPGLIVAGVSFIMPAACIVTAMAWAYVRFGALPAVAGVLYGVKPVVIAVVLQALWRLGKTAMKDTWLIILGGVAVIAVAMGVNELVVLAAGGLLATAPHRRRAPSARATLMLLARPATATPTRSVGAVVASGVGAAGAATTAALWPLFGVFLKIGAVLFGSGYVLLAFMRADLVERLHWLTERQLLDAVAVGQITPGPVFTAATFAGYLIAGGSGAMVATLGIFLPAFVFVAISGPLVPRLRRSAIAGSFLDGVNVVSLALMAVVTWQLTRAAVVDSTTVVIAAASGLVLFRFRLNSAWLVLGGAAIGMVARFASGS